MADVFAVAWLVTLGAKLLWHLENHLDLTLFDEIGMYLYPGVTADATHPLPGAAWGPLYCLWYKALSLVQPDRVALYYLNYEILTVLVPLLFYAVLRACRVAPWASAIGATLLLLSEGNMTVVPRVAHFALCVLFATFVAVRAIRQRPVALCVLCAGLLATSYVRPEQYLAFLIVLGYIVVSLGRRAWLLTRQTVTSLLCLALLTVACVVRTGSPLSSNGETPSRSLIAFGQHYAFFWVQKHGGDMRPFEEWPQLLTEHFGQIDSVTGALRANPRAVLSHITDNAGRYARYVVILLGAFLFPRPLQELLQRAPFLTIAPSLVLVYLARNREGRFFQALAARFHEFDTVTIGALAAAGVCIPSYLIVAPKWHILFFQLPILVLLIVLLFLRRFSAPLRVPAPVWLAAAVAFLAMGPSPHDYFANYPPVNRRTIAFLRSLDPPSRLSVFHYIGGLDLYLQAPRIATVEYTRSKPFSQYLRANDIGAVLYSPELASDKYLSKDPSWQKFLQDWDTDGFARLRIPDTPNLLFVRKEYLAPNAVQKPHAALLPQASSVGVQS